MIVLFFTAQVMDGVLTYLGVVRFGPGVEANPLLAWMMAACGTGAALAAAKATAVGFGAMLHLLQVHVVVAALTAIYLAAAIGPWLTLLLT